MSLFFAVTRLIIKSVLIFVSEMSDDIGNESFGEDLCAEPVLVFNDMPILLVKLLQLLESSQSEESALLMEPLLSLRSS